MKIEDKLSKQDAKRDMNDETKEILIKPCTKRFEVKRAKQYIDGAYNPCFYCNQFGTYVMFGHKYICDEYEVEE